MPGTSAHPHDSVGIATGSLIGALHRTGLATFTHTPSPMGFLGTVLERPRDEMPFLLVVVHAADHCRVPDIQRLPLQACASFI